MYVDWEYYKIFYYVAKYQNFTKAARVLGNNQPNITHSMNRLESQLNCVLFIRSNIFKPDSTSAGVEMTAKSTSPFFTACKACGVEWLEMRRRMPG